MTFSPKNQNLRVEFPTKTGTPVIRYLIFVGAATVREERKANYIQYNPIGRNSSLFAYAGGESRTFTVDYTTGFNIIKQSELASNIDFISDTATKALSDEDKKLLFFSNTASDSDGIFRKTGAAESLQNSPDDKILKFLDYQISLIRSMCLNNAEDPTVGPPLVRLNFGLLYEDIPCIVETYNITLPTSQDLTAMSKLNFLGNTLVPENGNYTISMTLKEVRTGNFLRTKFKPSEPVSRDNNVGFEQIIGDSINSIDPGRIK